MISLQNRVNRLEQKRIDDEFMYQKEFTDTERAARIASIFHRANASEVNNEDAERADKISTLLDRARENRLKAKG